MVFTSVSLFRLDKCSTGDTSSRPSDIKSDALYSDIVEHKKYYRVPDPIINKKEQESLKDLTARYEKLSQPNAIVGDTRCQERKTADKENKHQMKVY